jgi:thiol:disulfide interchange protein DsbD
LGLAAASFGAQIRGFLQGTAFQVIISLTFFVLAFSMFDVFMIQAPNSVRNKLSNIKTSGMFGIFFMGMVSGLMASPCVAAPLAGILAFIASTGSKFLGFFMLMFFAWGMSFPLLLIGAFSGSLNSLPKAGEWMIRVKEFYGFLLLGASLFFIQPLLGPSWTDILMALLLAAFAAYLGLFTQIENGAPLLPRVMKSFGVVAIAVSCAFAISATSKWGGLCMSQPNDTKAIKSATKFFWHTKLEDAVKEAQKTKKPIFVDFRAEWCSICKELERDVFPDPKISVLFDKMVLLKIDTTNLTPEIEALIKKFQVIGLPTLVTLDSYGNEIPALRMVGEVSVEHLENNLRRAL